MKKVIFLILLVPFLAGCGTYFARSGWRNESSDIPRFYPATAMDYGMMSIWRDNPNTQRKSVGTKILWSSVGLIDTPISIVTDTICIPLDIWAYEPRK